ncbi:hypothetical protein [Sphingopyxis chilensis]
MNRHPGLDPGATTSTPQWIPDQVRDDEGLKTTDCGRAVMLAQRNMPKLPTSSSVFRLFLWYLWSIPIVVAVLHIFDLHFEYDGDLMFWVIAGYIAPAGLLSEAVGQGFGVGLSIYIILLAVITAWSVRRSRRANAAV